MTIKTTVTDEEALAVFESGEGFDPEVYTTPADTADIRAAVKVREYAQTLIDKNVIKARRQGSTWLEIAIALGVSPQAAQKKYRDQV